MRDAGRRARASTATSVTTATAPGRVGRRRRPARGVRGRRRLVVVQPRGPVRVRRRRRGRQQRQQRQQRQHRQCAAPVRRAGERRSASSAATEEPTTTLAARPAGVHRRGRLHDAADRGAGADHAAGRPADRGRGPRDRARPVPRRPASTSMMRKVTVDGPYDAWYVTIEPRIDGLLVSGLVASTSPSAEGRGHLCRRRTWTSPSASATTRCSTPAPPSTGSTRRRRRLRHGRPRAHGPPPPDDGLHHGRCSTAQDRRRPARRSGTTVDGPGMRRHHRAPAVRPTPRRARATEPADGPRSRRPAAERRPTVYEPFAAGRRRCPTCPPPVPSRSRMEVVLHEAERHPRAGRRLRRQQRRLPRPRLPLHAATRAAVVDVPAGRRRVAPALPEPVAPAPLPAEDTPAEAPTAVAR